MEIVRFGFFSRASPCRAEANVVREDGSSDDVVMAVDGVGAVDDRDPQSRGHRRLLEAVDHIRPHLRRRILCRVAPSSVQNAPWTKRKHKKDHQPFFSHDLHPQREREREPMNWERRTAGEATERSIWVIWPIFSARVIRERRSLTRASTGRVGFLYGSSGEVTTSAIATFIDMIESSSRRRRRRTGWFFLAAMLVF